MERTEKHFYDLRDLGWDKEYENEYKRCSGTYDVGRVAVQYKNLYKVYWAKGELLASISGKMNYEIADRREYPAVGDWVLLSGIGQDEERAVIQGIMTRRSRFSRKTAGRVVEEQVIAANIDIVFICMSLNQNFNLRRLERYITVSWDSGATPVVVLTKSDLCPYVMEKMEAAQNAAFGVDVLAVSCRNKSGLSQLRQYIQPGKTVAFLGSSGVGKSTIINELLGEEKQYTQAVRQDDDRGRHSTTNRELILLPGGGIVIDTPGMRELHVLDVEESIGSAFDDVEHFASGCKFTDCSHTVEPGCAVKDAIESGLLSRGRYENYIKLKKEADFIERKIDEKAGREYKQFKKKLSKEIKEITKGRRR
jgi:ribosome biogenesis GTPase